MSHFDINKAALITHPSNSKAGWWYTCYVSKKTLLPHVRAATSTAVWLWLLSSSADCLGVHHPKISLQRHLKWVRMSHWLHPDKLALCVTSILIPDFSFFICKSSLEANRLEVPSAVGPSWVLNCAAVIFYHRSIFWPPQLHLWTQNSLFSCGTLMWFAVNVCVCDDLPCLNRVH